MIDLIGTLRRLYTRLGAPAGASMSVDIAAIMAELTTLGLQYVEGSVSDAGPAAADFDTDLAEATDDHYNGMLLMFTDGVCAGQAHVIDNYAAANGNCAFSADDIWTDVPGDGDNFVIMPAVGAKLGIPAGVSVSADIAAITAALVTVDTEVGDIATAVAALSQVSPFEQLCPILMNAPRTANEAALTNAAGNKEFIPTNTIAASNLYSTDDGKVSKVTLIIIGRAVNTYAGSNALDCATAAHNQWQMSLGAGAYADLTNEVADGQMLDNDWLCPVEGAIHPFTFGFDITTEMTDIDGHIGVQLLNGRAEQTSLIVTCDIYLKVVWLP